MNAPANRGPILRSNYFDFDALSASMLKELARTPFHFWSKYVERSVPDEETSALRKGNGVHCLTFEPETFTARYPVFEGHKKTNEAKERYAELEALAESLEGSVLRESEIADVEGMARALRSDPRSARLLESLSHPEFPFAWNDVDTGILCKARLDGLAMSGRVILELKSIADASDERISREILNRNYHIAAAHYDAGVRAHFGTEPEAFVFMFVENSAPYATNIRTLAPIDMERGRVRRAELMATLTRCRESGRWPAYGETIEPIGLPSWA